MHGMEEDSPCSDASCSTCDPQAEQKRFRPDHHGRAANGGMFTGLDSSDELLDTSSDFGGSALTSAPSSRESSFTSCCSPFASSPEQPAQPADVDQWKAREAYYTPQGIFKRQTQVTPAMREMLVEWMCEVAIQYRMHLETFLLAVNYVDRYLSQVSVSRSRFQLLGLTCLWVAAKYEEVHPPSAKQLLQMANNAYTRADMLAVEGDVLRQLEWQLSPATCLKFMHLYLVNTQATSCTVQAVGECMLQLAALDWQLCAEQPPAHVAAAAACVALTACQLTHLVPQVMVASGWSDAHALAQMSHDLYARFGRLSAPGMPFHPIIAHYAQRQRAINRHMQLEDSLAEVMVPVTPCAAPGPQPAFTAKAAAAAPVTAPSAEAQQLQQRVADKLGFRAVALGAKGVQASQQARSMDCCTGATDQTHKLKAFGVCHVPQQLPYPHVC